nr:hypothetical protein [Neobacillus sp. 179.-C4.2 HS]
MPVFQSITRVTRGLTRRNKLIYLIFTGITTSKESPMHNYLKTNYLFTNIPISLALFKEIQVGHSKYFSKVTIFNVYVIDL